jgi:hypothetical protein
MLAQEEAVLAEGYLALRDALSIVMEGTLS